MFCMDLMHDTMFATKQENANWIAARKDKVNNNKQRSNEDSCRHLEDNVCCNGSLPSCLPSGFPKLVYILQHAFRHPPSLCPCFSWSKLSDNISCWSFEFQKFSRHTEEVKHDAVLVSISPTPNTNTKCLLLFFCLSFFASVVCVQKKKGISDVTNRRFAAHSTDATQQPRNYTTGTERGPLTSTYTAKPS